LGSGLLRYRSQRREARLWGLDCFATARKDEKQGFGVWIALLLFAKTGLLRLLYPRIALVIAYGLDTE